MTPELIGVIGIFLMVVLFLFKVPVGVSLLIVGFIGTGWIRGWDNAFTQLGRTAFDTATTLSLSVIPLFILMGMILSYSGLGGDLYRAVDSWIGHFRGGLAMATIGTASIFSAISGSLNATTATMAKITLPEMEKYKYSASLSTACVAAGGSLGILIPPSVILVLYGILTRENIGQLLIAGILPGILQMILFMITVAILVRRNPELAPARAEKADFKERWNSLMGVWPFILLFLISIGGIYFGFFTPTEAAGVGAIGALLFSFFGRNFKWEKIIESFNDSARLTASIFLILIGATVFGQFLTISRIPMELTSFIGSLDLNKYIILTLLLLALFVLGCFLEGLSLMVLTLPIVYPIISTLGFDGIWFGVLMVLAINIGSLTPPIGISVFVIKGVVPHIPIQEIFKGVVPMIFAMIACVILIVLFPQIAILLPDMMK